MNPKIMQLIENFKKVERPQVPDSDDVDDAWSDLMLDFADYMAWERNLLEGKETPSPNFTSVKKKLEKCKPVTEDDKKSLREMNEWIKMMEKIILESSNK